MKRPVTEAEKILVSRMAEALPDSKRSQIMADLANASVEPMNDDATIRGGSAKLDSYRGRDQWKPRGLGSRRERQVI